MKHAQLINTLENTAQQATDLPLHVRELMMDAVNALAQPAAVPDVWQTTAISVLKALERKFKSRVYGTGSYVTKELRESVSALLAAATQPSQAEPQPDYAAVIADHDRLVRELDVLLNGEKAAKQASLCDLVAQVKRMAEIAQNTMAEPQQAEPVCDKCKGDGAVNVGEPGTFGHLVRCECRPAPVPLTKDRIREIMLAHGFTIKDGLTDLKPYVYEAASAIERAALARHGNILLNVKKVERDSDQRVVVTFASARAASEFEAIAAKGGA